MEDRIAMELYAFLMAVYIDKRRKHLPKAMFFKILRIYKSSPYFDIKKIEDVAWIDEIQQADDMASSVSEYYRPNSYFKTAGDQRYLTILDVGGFSEALYQYFKQNAWVYLGVGNNQWPDMIVILTSTGDQGAKQRNELLKYFG